MMSDTTVAVANGCGVVLTSFYIATFARLWQFHSHIIYKCSRTQQVQPSTSFQAHPHQNGLILQGIDCLFGCKFRFYPLWHCGSEYCSWPCWWSLFSGLQALLRFLTETPRFLHTNTGNVIALSFFASPLSVMKTVLKEKSTAAMPFAVSLSSFGNCVAWALYGLFVAHDPMVMSCAQIHLNVQDSSCTISFCFIRWSCQI